MNLLNIRELEQKLIWDEDYRAAPAWKRLPVETLRALLYVGRGFGNGELTLRAMSLVYTTILSLVPLLAFSFSVLKGFGVQNRVEPLLLQYLMALGPEKSAEITERIVGFVNNIDVRVLGVMGLGLLVYTIVTLMQKIEAAFNHVWHLRRSRSLGERFSTFISVLTVGPLLVFSALAMTGSIMNNELMQWLSSREPFGMMLQELARLMPWLLIIAAFTFLYVLIPNTRVRLLPALAGGIVGGLLWEAAGYAFARFVASAGNYQAVYATFGTAILFMIWLYVSWLILLVGASVAYYVQHPGAVIARARRWRFSHDSFEALALGMLATITRRHYAREPGLSADALASHFGIAGEMMDDALAALRACAIIEETAEEPATFVLAVPPEETPVADIITTLREYHPAGSRPVRPPADAPVESVQARIRQARDDALQGLTLRDLAIESADHPAAAAATDTADGPAVIAGASSGA